MDNAGRTKHRVRVRWLDCKRAPTRATCDRLVQKKSATPKPMALSPALHEGQSYRDERAPSPESPSQNTHRNRRLPQDPSGISWVVGTEATLMLEPNVPKVSLQRSSTSKIEETEIADVLDVTLVKRLRTLGGCSSVPPLYKASHLRNKDGASRAHVETRCSHTRRFGTLAVPPPPVGGPPLGPHHPGYHPWLINVTRWNFVWARA